MGSFLIQKQFHDSDSQYNFNVKIREKLEIEPKQNNYGDSRV